MIELVSWDSDFFGRKIGLVPFVASETEADALIAEARDREFSYLSARLTPSDIPAIQILERKGFYTTDIGIVWHRGLEKIVTPQTLARQGTNTDNSIVQKIADGLFTDARFYNDPFFSKEEADRLYRTWAGNLLQGDADKVLLIGEEGFVACKTAGNVGSIILIGVSAVHQKKGVGTELVLNALAWFKKVGMESVSVRTQAANRGAIALYEARGFRMKSMDITMGRIIERNREHWV